MLRDIDDPLPYYPWYVKDFRADRRYKNMSWQARGAFHELLDDCWLEGGIPTDLSKVAEIIGCTRYELDQMWPQLVVFFFEIEPGVLSSRRLERLRTTQDHHRAARARAGRQGGLAKSESQIDLLADAKQEQALAKQMPYIRVEKSRVEQSKEKKSKEEKKNDRLLPELVVEKWNAFATAQNFPVCRTWKTGSRARNLTLRCKDAAWCACVSDALAYLAVSTWHQENPISIDTFLRPGKVESYAEKLPTVRGNGAQSRGGARAAVDAGIAATLRDGKAGRRIVQGDDGWDGTNHGGRDDG